MDDDAIFDVLIAIYKNPKNKGKLKDATITLSDGNPSCGDTVTIYLKIKDNKIEDAKFEGAGCVISMAATSLLLEKLKDSRVNEISKLTNKDIFDLIGIDLSQNPTRLKCAMLALHILKQAF